MSPAFSQGGASKAKDRKKGGSSLEEAKRRGRMERSRAEEEEDVSEKLKTLVREEPGTRLLEELLKTGVCVCVCPECVQRPSSQWNRPGLL